ncbi:MAG: retropepsin-like aspartic protease family protein [Gammaproteobacteria bacterium]
MSRQIVTRLVERYRLTGRSSQLIPILSYEQSLDGGFAFYPQMLGRLRLQSGDYRLAIDDLNRAINIDASLQESLQPLIQRARSWLETPNQVEVPLQRGNGVYLVEARINDQAVNLRLVLDTGASLTVISPEAAARLGIKPVGAPKVRLRTANGTVDARRIVLESVQLESARRLNVDAAITELGGGLDGLLGMSFLSGFQVSVDSERGLLLLRHEPGF